MGPKTTQVTAVSREKIRREIKQEHVGVVARVLLSSWALVSDLLRWSEQDSWARGKHDGARVHAARQNGGVAIKGLRGKVGSRGYGPARAMEDASIKLETSLSSFARG